MPLYPPGVTRGTAEDQIPIWNNATQVWETLSPGSNDEVLSVSAGALDYRKVVNEMVDNAAAISFSKLASEAFSTYVPAWTSTGTAPALGNGSASGFYFKVGRLLVVMWTVVLGGTSTVGTGTYRFSLPEAFTATTGIPIGLCRYNDSSGSEYLGGSLPVSSTTFDMRVTAGNTALATCSATAPVVPASGDRYSGVMIGEAAS